jgi:hypothetical protein
MIALEQSLILRTFVALGPWNVLMTLPAVRLALELLRRRPKINQFPGTYDYFAFVDPMILFTPSISDN